MKFHSINIFHFAIILSCSRETNVLSAEYTLPCILKSLCVRYRELIKSRKYYGHAIYYCTVTDNNNCGNQTFRNSAGVITSSDFTGRINCTYNIEAGRNKSVLLQLTFPADYSRFSYLTHYHYRHGDCAYTWLQVSWLDFVKL